MKQFQIDGWRPAGPGRCLCPVCRAPVTTNALGRAAHQRVCRPVYRLTTVDDGGPVVRQEFSEYRDALAAFRLAEVTPPINSASVCKFGGGKLLAQMLTHERKAP